MNVQAKPKNFRPMPHPTVARIMRQARVSEDHARVAARLAGVAVDEWQPLGDVAAAVVHKIGGHR